MKCQKVLAAELYVSIKIKNSRCYAHYTPIKGKKVFAAALYISIKTKNCQMLRLLYTYETQKSARSDVICFDKNQKQSILR